MKKEITILLICIISLSFIKSGCPNQENIPTNPISRDYGALRLYTSNAGGNWALLYNMKYDNASQEIFNIQKLGCFDSDIRSLTIIGTSNSNIYLTTNTGGSWIKTVLPVPPSAVINPYDITNLSLEGTGFICGDYGVWKSTDNGANWVRFNDPFPSIISNEHYNCIDFCDETKGIAMPDDPNDTTIYTTNGGVSWNIGGRTDNSAYINDISFISSFPGTEAVVCGNSGRIFRTTDLGVTWQLVTAPVNNDLYAIDFIDPVGITVGSGGTILRTADRGMTWSVVNSSVSNTLRGVYLEGTYYWAVGDNVVLRSEDQGQTWTVVRNVSDEFYTDMVFIKGEGVVVGSKRQ